MEFSPAAPRPRSLQNHRKRSRKLAITATTTFPSTTNTAALTSFSTVITTVVALIKTAMNARPAPRRGNPRDQCPPPGKYGRNSCWMRGATCPEDASKVKPGRWRRKKRRNQTEALLLARTSAWSTARPAGGTGRQTRILSKRGRNERRSCKRWKLMEKDWIPRCIREMKTCLWSNRKEAEGDNTDWTGVQASSGNSLSNCFLTAPPAGLKIDRLQV